MVRRQTNLGDTSELDGLYQVADKMEDGREAASRALNEAGIPGIKYFDGSSRSAQEGTRNMVLFEPESVIRSVKRDSETVFEKSKLEKAMELVDKY
jgi:hypothetical protein